MKAFFVKTKGRTTVARRMSPADKLLANQRKDRREGREVFVASDCVKSEDGRLRVGTQARADNPGVTCGTYFADTTAELSYLLATASQTAGFNNAPFTFTGNKADRRGNKKGENGSRFAIAELKDGSHIISTTGGWSWSVARRYLGVRQIFVLDFPASIELLYRQGLITEKTAKRLKRTQFRSLYLTTLLKYWRAGYQLEGTWEDVGAHCDSLFELELRGKAVIGFEDEFFNLYTLHTADALGLQVGKKYRVKCKEAKINIKVRFVERLADAKDGEIVLTNVSAGVGKEDEVFVGLMKKSKSNKKGKWSRPFKHAYPGCVLKIEEM